MGGSKAESISTNQGGICSTMTCPPSHELKQINSQWGVFERMDLHEDWGPAKMTPTLALRSPQRDHSQYSVRGI